MINEEELKVEELPVSEEKELDLFDQGRKEHPEDDDIIVKMRDVRVAFKIGSIERVIINHLNLDIKRGEVLGLVGESGSGKTTIGRALIRINKVSGGEITFNNVKISGKIPRKTERLLKTKMQMIFQDPGDSLNDRANIDYIVSEGLRAFKLYKSEEDRLQKVSHMMERVGLRPEYLNRYPHEFSGGQRQRSCRGCRRRLSSRPRRLRLRQGLHHASARAPQRRQALGCLARRQESQRLRQRHPHGQGHAPMRRKRQVTQASRCARFARDHSPTPRSPYS